MAPQTATAMQTPKPLALTSQPETDDLFDRFQQVNDSIAKRAFEIFDGNGRQFGKEISDWLQAESEVLHPVHLEIAETEQALTARAEVPGFTAKELRIRVQGNRLTIAGKHESTEESTKGKTIYWERCAKEVFRSIELPSEVDGQSANATLKDGILQIELPKGAHGSSARIEAKENS